MLNKRIFVPLVLCFLAAAENAQALPRVCIDERDRVSYCGVSELSLTGPVMDYLQDMLSNAGFNPWRSRNCSGADFILPIWMDSIVGSSAEGTHVYYNPTDPSYDSARNIQNRLVIASQRTSSRPILGDNVTGSYHNSGHPTTTVYLGYITSCDVDVPKIRNRAYEYALAICEGMAVTYGLSPTACQPRATLSGRVTDESGSGIGNVSVSISVQGQSGTWNRTTDSSGYWSIELPPEDYNVYFSRSGYGSKSRKCPLSRGGSSCDASLSQNKGSMHGAVYDGAGHALSGFSASSPLVTIVQDGGNSWKATGRPGTHQITFTASGYDSTTISCTIYADDNTACPDARLALQTGFLGGEVICQGSTEAAAITVTAPNGRTTSINYNGSGKWQLGSLEPGSYTVSATPNSSTSQCSGGNTTCYVAAGQDNPNCSIAMTKKDPGTLVGTVVDAITKNTIPAEIQAASALSTEKSVSTHYNGSGQYSIQLDEGSYTVTASNEDYKPSAAQNCRMVQRGKCVCDFELMPLGGSIIVKVYDSENDMFLPADISIRNTNAAAQNPPAPKRITDEFVRFDGVNGEFEVSASSVSEEIEFKAESKTCTIGPNQNQLVILEASSIDKEKSMIIGNVVSAYDHKTPVPARIRVKEIPEIETGYTGEFNWRIQSETDGYLTIMVEPIDADAYQPAEGICTIGSKDLCTIESVPVITYEESEEGTADLDHRVADVEYQELGSCSASGSARLHFFPMLFFIGIAGAGLVMRRRNGRKSMR